MSRPCTLTAKNGMSIKIDYDDMTSFGPHASGGSFVNFKGNTIQVQETPEQILSKATIIQ